MCAGCVHWRWRPADSGSKGVQGADLPLPPAAQRLHRQRSFPAPKVFLQRSQPDVVGGHSRVRQTHHAQLTWHHGWVWSIYEIWSTSSYKYVQHLVCSPSASWGAIHLLHAELFRLLIVSVECWLGPLGVGVWSCWKRAGSGMYCRMGRSRAFPTCSSMQAMQGVLSKILAVLARANVWVNSLSKV